MKEQCTAYHSFDDFIEELEDAERELPDNVEQLRRRLPSLHKGLEEILKVLSTPGAKKLPELKNMKSILRARILALEGAVDLVSSKGPEKISEGNSSVCSASHDRSSRLKMPSIEMPQFSGEMLDWEHFWQDFSAALSHDTELTDSDKAIYLSSAVKSKEAKAILAIHPLSEDITTRWLKLSRINMINLEKYIVPESRSISIVPQLEEPRSRSRRPPIKSMNKTSYTF